MSTIKRMVLAVVTIAGALLLIFPATAQQITVQAARARKARE